MFGQNITIVILTNYHNLKHRHEINHFHIEFLITLNKLALFKIDKWLSGVYIYKKKKKR